MIDNLLCEENKTLVDALSLINENTLGTVFIVDSNKKLKGILTDGDIRRLLLEGISLGEPVANHYLADITVAYEGESVSEMVSKTNERVIILPVVDENKIVKDFFHYNSKIHLPVASPNLRGNEFKYLVDAFLSTWISSAGEYITKFEEQFSTYCEAEYGVATSNGTVAIHLALAALDIGQGDEVIVPDFTFAATINAVILAGATPVIVGIEKDSWCISPEEIKKAISEKTKAIIPVHIYGQPCDMDSIMSIAEQNNLYVIEDCAEAHGATYKGKKVGSFGHINTFSFFANKIITTGEGGMCLTNSKELDEKMRTLRDHGMNKQKRYWHDVVGFNYRMTNLQAAIGVAQLERIDKIIEEKRAIEKSYTDTLKEFDFVQFQSNEIANTKKVTWLTSALITNGKRDYFMDQMKAKGIDARPFFYPLSDMDVFKPYVFSTTNCSAISVQGLNFPSTEQLDEQTKQVLIETFSANA